MNEEDRPRLNQIELTGSGHSGLDEACELVWIDGRPFLAIGPKCPLVADLAAPPEEGRRFSDVRVDRRLRDVIVNGRSVHLTKTELKLFLRLRRAEGQIIPHAILFGDVWGMLPGKNDNDMLRSHFRNIRKKFHEAGFPDNAIESSRGRGYRLPGWLSGGTNVSVVSSGPNPPGQLEGMMNSQSKEATKV
ncbi:MAG TPA: winged helix-turn-helix domain-containing protein [Dehalococcoidia bacterium]|nr:winged helix-turn-helix domain-containing protein [Dehalococcoidia bacterium]